MSTTTAFRFRPPDLPLTPQLRWVLLRAFGPLAAPSPAGVDVAAAAELAARLGVAARIGARARRAPELAAAAAATAQLARASAVAEVAQLQGREAAGEVAAAAAEAGVACCFLKGAALAGLGLLAPGSRTQGDLDVLAAPEGAAALAEALVRRGFVAAAGEPYPHQLPALVHVRLGMVEVHRHLPGVTSPGGAGFATLAELADAALLVPWHELGSAAWLPARPALTAHLLAHALAQHGFQPAAYPGLRLLGDLLDLGIAGDGGEALEAQTLPLVALHVPTAEAQAAAALCRRLALGDGAVGSGLTDTDGLLRHLLAGRLDTGYQLALKLQELAYPLHPVSRWAGRWSAVLGALFLSRAQIDLLYGRPRGRWGYLGRRLWRPLDLLARVGRALRARGIVAG